MSQAFDTALDAVARMGQLHLVVNNPVPAFVGDFPAWLREEMRKEREAGMIVVNDNQFSSEGE